MLPLLVYWPTTLEADAGGMTIEVKPSREWFASSVTVQQIATGEQSGKVQSDMLVHTKQRCH
jgi:hypothetical protein